MKLTGQKQGTKAGHSALTGGDIRGTGLPVVPSLSLAGTARWAGEPLINLNLQNGAGAPVGLGFIATAARSQACSLMKDQSPQQLLMRFCTVVSNLR